MRPAPSCHLNSVHPADSKSYEGTRYQGCGACAWYLRLGFLALLIATFLGSARAGNNPAPSIAAVSPASVTAGATNVTLTVAGGGFITGSTVQWNGSALTTTFVSATKLTATVPDSLVYGKGTAAVTVLNAAPGGGTSSPAYLPVGQTETNVNFGSGISTTVGSNPLGAAAGDFNGDGIPDLAVANGNDGTVSILLGNGDGTFTSKSTPSVGSVPVNIAVADFDGDGKADLAVSNSSSDTVSILLGDGTGNFTLKSSPGTSVTPVGIAVGDFNGDGHPDLVVGNLNSTNLNILLGNGDGTFTAGSNPSVGSDSAGVVVGDFNEDGILDIAAATNGAPSISILLGVGDGTFQTYATVSTPNVYSWGIAAADFNKDGHLDLAVAGNSYAAILQNDGTATFTVKSTIDLGSSSGASANTLAIGDFNGDGNLDLMVPVQTLDFCTFTFFDDLVLLPGNGDGTVGTAQTTPAGSSGQTAYQVAVADFNNDGELDVAAPLTNTSVAAFLQVLPVALSPASVTFPSQNTGVASTPVTVTLKNNTGGTLTVTGVSIAGADPGDFMQNDTCTSVAAAATCTISVTFTPAAAGNRAALLTITDSEASSPQTVALAGIGIQTAPIVNLSTPSLAFSAQQVGTTSAAQTATLSVTGSIALNISSISVMGSSSADFHESDDCGSSVAASAHCTISVTITPTAIGSRTAAVTITDNAGDSPESVTLAGTATPGTPAITWATPANIASGTALSGTQLDATANVSGSFIYAPPAGTVLGIGSHTLSAAFTPTDTTDYTSASGNVTITVGKGTTTTTLSQPASSYFGDSVTLTATVASTATGTPSGTVTFLDGSATLGTGTIGQNGTATFSTTSLTVGSHSLSASYGGDTNFGSSSSATVSDTVNATYSLTVPGGTVTAAPGGTTQITITVPPAGGAFTGAVTMSVSGLPAGATATFNPPAVTPGTAGASTIMSVTFPASAIVAPASGKRIPLGPAGAAAMLCFFFLVWSGRRGKMSRALATVACLALLASPALLLSGCGSTAAPTTTPQPQTIILTVTGTNGAIQHSTTVTINLT